MTNRPVDYDSVASQYHSRYDASPMAGIAAALYDVTGSRDVGRALDAGCGTGRWQSELASMGWQTIGLDTSRGMLAQAQARDSSLPLVQGQAEQLPFDRAAFDLVASVNALHHFTDPRQFVAEAQRVLKPAGMLVIVGASLPGQRGDWYLYDYFPGTYAVDAARYPAWEAVRGWLDAAGFGAISHRVVQRIRTTYKGRDVLRDPFLLKHSTSQLVLLSDEAYQAGLARIEAAVAQAEATGQEIVFPVQIDMGMMVGYVTA